MINRRILKKLIYRRMAAALVVSIIAIPLLLAMTDRSTNAQGTDLMDEMSKKIDGLVAGQKEILERLDNLSEELRIVKIRVTQSQ